MHIGLILDGNRRWAKSRGLPKVIGHKKGIENFEEIVRYAADHPVIEAVSAFALSTENLKRSRFELKNLYRIFEQFCKRKEEFVRDGIAVSFFGNLGLLPDRLQKAFFDVFEFTRGGSRLRVNLCVAFGGRDEIVRAAVKLAESGEEWSEQNLEKHLDSYGSPPLDLLIRTGGSRRLSNFLLWESAYSELYFTETLWPDFSPEELEKAITFYEGQKRNFGK